MLWLYKFHKIYNFHDIDITWGLWLLESSNSTGDSGYRWHEFRNQKANKIPDILYAKYSIKGKKYRTHVPQRILWIQMAGNLQKILEILMGWLCLDKQGFLNLGYPLRTLRFGILKIRQGNQPRTTSRWLSFGQTSGTGQRKRHIDIVKERHERFITISLLIDCMMFSWHVIRGL